MRLRPYLLAMAFVALTFVLALYSYGRLPEQVPVHWNLAGDVDGWMPRLWGAFALPFVGLVVTALLIAAPLLGRDGTHLGSPPRVYPVVVAAIAGFHLCLTAIILLFAMGASIPVMPSMGVAVGVLIAIVGNYMGKLPRNGLIGLRLPWTLASDEVWERTHRFAAPILVIGGLCLVLVSVATPKARSPLPMIAILTIATLVPSVKSWFIWRECKRRGNPPA